MNKHTDLFITSMITDRNGRHEGLLPFNHKNYDFREKKNTQVVKEGENLHWNTYKGYVNILRPLRLLPEIWHKKNTHKGKGARTHARNYSFECDWLS